MLLISVKKILTCNYDPAFPKDFEKGINQFGIRYDERIFDRLFSDFNLLRLGELV